MVSLIINIYLHQTFTGWVSNKYTHFYMPNVTAGYGRISDLIAFFGPFIHNLVLHTYLKRYIFTKLSQFVRQSVISNKHSLKLHNKPKYKKTDPQYKIKFNVFKKEGKSLLSTLKIRNMYEMT